MKWKHERRAPIQWDDGERERLIEAALARGHVTKVPPVKADEGPEPLRGPKAAPGVVKPLSDA